MLPRPRSQSGTVALLAAVLAVGALAPRPAVAQQAPLELVFTSGSEKKEWLAAVTADYMKTNPTVDGRPVKVVVVSMGSGESMEAIREPEKWEAASEAEIKRAAEEVKRATADVDRATADAKGNAAAAAFAERLAAVRKRLESTKRPDKVKEARDDLAGLADEGRATPADWALAIRLADAARRLEDAKKSAKKAAETKLAARAHLTSPASRAFVRMANAECAAAKQPLLVDADRREDSLVQSAVVIALWEPMAKALGWPKKDIGWSDIYALAQDPQGWEGKFPKSTWGRFKFGHTHPELSNSGLLAVLAEAYYGAEKAADLTAEDIARPKLRQKMAEIEKSVLFYGQSTGFFGDTMVEGGLSLLSAGILYEDQVIKANDPENALEHRLIAIYPAEGTFMSDHPVGVVEREWVTPAHKQAAKDYLAFLRQDAQQARAMTFGFRPGKNMELDPAKFSEKNGVDAKQPRAELLDVPSAPVMKEILKLWHEVRKPLRVALVLDTSASMIDPDKNKFKAAKAAAVTFVNKLQARDELTLLPFNSGRQKWAIDKPLKMDEAGKKAAVDAIQELQANYQTALYDAVAAAFDQLKAEKRQDVTTAIVVLSDGADNGDRQLAVRNREPISIDPDPKGTDRPRLPGDVDVLGPDGKPVRLGSTISLEELIAKIKFDPEGAATRVFTIAYGADADPDTLDKISKRTRAVMYPSTPGDIERVLQLILRDQ